MSRALYNEIQPALCPFCRDMSGDNRGQAGRDGMSCCGMAGERSMGGMLIIFCNDDAQRAGCSSAKDDITWD